MAKGQEENKQTVKKDSTRVNGVVIALIFFVFDLILFGAFGAAGNKVADFFIGIFGYAIYGYSLGLTVLGILFMLKLKPSQSKKIVLIYSLIVLTTITFAHILGSHNYALNGWGKYISQSYSGADTAGGAIASIFLYLFATKHIYILTLVANGIITVGLIAIAVLLQVNININVGERKRRSVKGASAANINVYDVEQPQQSQSLNNQTIKGRNLGEKLFRRGKRNTLDDYEPIENVNIGDEGQQQFSFDSYQSGYDQIDFTEDYYQGGDTAQDNSQLIMNTQEIRDEIERNNRYIYAGNDVEENANAQQIGQIQSEIFGIDPNRKLNVINEGMQNNGAATQSAQNIDSMRAAQNNNRDTQDTARNQQNVKKRMSPYERFQSDSLSSNDYFDTGHKPSYYDKMQNVQDEQSIEPSGIQENAQAPINVESGDVSNQIVSEAEGLGFGERISQMMDAGNISGLESFEFPYGKAAKKEQENKVDDANIESDNLRAEQNSSSPVVKEDKPVENVANTDVSANDNAESSKQDKPTVEDRTEKSRGETIDEFIARTNREKEANQPSPVVNYNTKDDVVVKKDSVSSDGYVQKTYDKPTLPTATPQPKPSKPNIVNGANNTQKTTENNAVKEEEKAKPVKTPYVAPSIDNLVDYVPDIDENEDFMERARIIEKTYGNFGIEVHVKNIVSGPSVTRYEFEIPETLSVDRIPSKINNILMALAVETARIEAPIPGKSLCGIEVPNKVRKTVGLKEFLTSDTFKNKKGGLYFALGKDVDNNCHYEDLTDFPHGLIAGGTGSGKSVCLNTMLCSLIYKYSPEELRIILVDPKRVEFSKYQALPHLLTPKIYNTPKETIGVLKWLVAEMERRYALFAKRFVAKISSYNATPEVIEADERIPYIVAIIDEVGDIMVNDSAKEFETYVLTLAQKARACGIHLILATQRPSVDVITGNIKANLPTRIAFAVTTGTDSRTILDSIGAEDLLGKGDMLVKTTKSRYMVRLQNPFIDDGEIQNIMRDIVTHNTAYYDETIESEIAEITEPKKEEPAAGKAVEKTREFDFPDELCPVVLKKIVNLDSVSISFMQRAFSVGFSRGGKIFDWLTSCGYIEKQGTKYVCVLTDSQVDEIIENARLGSDGEGDEE